MIEFIQHEVSETEKEIFRKMRGFEIIRVNRSGVFIEKIPYTKPIDESSQKLEENEHENFLESPE